VVQEGSGHLPEIVLALSLAGRLARGLNRRQQKSYEHADDRNHDQQFHERKRSAKKPLRAFASRHNVVRKRGLIGLGTSVEQTWRLEPITYRAVQR
jgi:hypothetical protein